MADVAKYRPVVSGGALASDLRSLASMVKTRRTVAFAYVCMLCFVFFTLLFAFNPNPTIFGSGDPDSGAGSGTRLSSVFSYYFPEIAEIPGKVTIFNPNRTNPVVSDLENPRFDAKNDTKIAYPFAPAGQYQSTSSPPAESEQKNGTVKTEYRRSSSPTAETEPTNSTVKTEYRRSSSPPAESDHKNSTLKTEYGRSSDPPAQSLSPAQQAQPGPATGLDKVNGSVAGSTRPSVIAPAKKRSNVSDSGSVESLLSCDLYDGDWVMDDSYPLYKPGSCPIIDEQFSCISNGRPDKDYLKYKWKPNGCTLPRLNPNSLLQMLKHKRLVFVGDSLNRNMWESMVCILSSAVKNRENVFESHGRHQFRGEAEYSFVFKDYNFTVEFYVSPFLVQEWEIKDKDGTPKERLRLDLIGKTSGDYKGADILIFNTGHWWTHEKTSLGKDYYQEGRHVYEHLNALEAFRKALTTWGRWVDANVDPKKSIVLFRGYSASHFSGGQWNSGGACDNETEPINNPKYLTAYPTKMTVLEEVLKGMKMDVKYLNITRQTDYRKDGHPSIYRKKKIPEAERKAPMRYQDCSHWCLPGVPDTWNELLYAELLIRQQQQQQQQ